MGFHFFFLLVWKKLKFFAHKDVKQVLIVMLRQTLSVYQSVYIDAQQFNYESSGLIRLR